MFSSLSFPPPEKPRTPISRPRSLHYTPVFDGCASLRARTRKSHAPKRSKLQAKVTANNMGHIQDIERDFRTLYRETPVDEIEETLSTFVKTKVLESYKNGLKAGRVPRKRPKRDE